MKKADFDNIQLRKFQIHSYILANPQCTANEVALAIDYNITSARSRIKELMEQGLIARARSKAASAFVFRSLTEPLPVLKFEPEPVKTMPFMLLSKLWLPGNLVLG
jgi:DNA-binding MarR family transcriptional regulator